MGLAVTAYGWVGALAALLSGAMPTRISCKALLVGLMLILALSCLAATRSYSMFALMSARMIGALAHGAFWACNWHCRRAAGAAAPAGAGHGDHFWRRVSGKRSGGAAGELYRHPGGLATRVYVDGLAVTSRRCGAVLDAAPAGRPCPVRLRVYRDIFRNPLLGGLYGATACIITAHFAAFTYIEPLLINLQGSPGDRSLRPAAAVRGFRAAG